MTTARLRILDYLHKHHTATAVEISQSLGLTPADVRYHLKALRSSGSVEPAISRTPSGRGRPAKAYRLALKSRPNDLPFLVGLLLNHLQSTGDLLADLAAQSFPQPSEGAAITPRLNRLIQHLNNHHYEARWEAHAGGPRVVLSNCPYAAIVGEHPELCQMDRSIIERWSKMTAEQITRIDLETLAPPACLFSLHDKRAAK